MDPNKNIVLEPVEINGFIENRVFEHELEEIAKFETSERFEEALEFYEELIHRFPSHVKFLLWKKLRLCIQLEQWSNLSQIATRLLDRIDLTHQERMGAQCALGLAQIEQGLFSEAQNTIFPVRDWVEDHHIGETNVPPSEVGFMYLVLGEMRKHESEKFILQENGFLELFEKRCSHLLSAQDAFVNAMRSQDKWISSMAAFRMGELYFKLYKDIFTMDLSAKIHLKRDKMLFEAALHIKYKILLKKALYAMDSLISFEKKTEFISTWTAKAKKTRIELGEILSKEQKIYDEINYTEQDLQKALEKLSSSRSQR